MNIFSITSKKVLSILIAGGIFFVGYWYGSVGTSNLLQREVRQFSDNAFHFTNPLLECDLGKEYISQGKPRPSRSLIEEYISIQKQMGRITDASVYFRDLNNGPWIGINEKELFLPASLLKVPVTMYFYKESENEIGFLDTEVVAPRVVYESQIDQYFKPSKQIITGQTYTYRALIEYAIRYSDNDATSILLNLSGGNHVRQLFKDLHLDLEVGSNAQMSVKDYATFFRVLYNTSYLNLDNSNEFLKLLSETDFDQGIRKYIPRSITVSHKFGEVNLDTLGQTQLHDCGIVYYPSHPYIMCVMTRGAHKDVLAEVIATISQMVYEQIESQVE